jgi:hypothetical protein
MHREFPVKRTGWERRWESGCAWRGVNEVIGSSTSTSTYSEPVQGDSQGTGQLGGVNSFGRERMAKHRIYTMTVASVYPHYVAKAEKKGRTQAEVDQIIRWLTGYTSAGLAKHLKNGTDFETFFGKAPKLNPQRELIKGVICGVRIEEIEDPLMREVRYLDKLVDELAKGRPMEKILRKAEAD